MEVTWKYNWLETLGFLFLIFFGGILIVRSILLVWLNGKFKNWW